MRVLMFDNEFPPLGGGTGVVNYHLLDEFAAYPELTIDLITSSRTPSTYEIERFADRITIYKVPVDNQNIHHSSNRELLRYSARGLQYGHRLLKQQQYELGFAFAGVPAGVMSYVLWKTHRLPYIVSLQGPDVPGFEARYNYLYPVLTPLLRRVWRSAALVTAISQQHRDLALRTTPELAIPIIFNGVDTTVFTPASLSTDCIRIVCVGRLIERKGQQHLLHALASLHAQRPDSVIRVQLVGTGDAETALQQLASELGVAELVEFTGFVGRDQMPMIYHQAHIFTLPSQSEGMSIALLEAMASGLPVVVTNTGGTDELVTDGTHGFVVEWAQVEQLTAALLKLIDNPALRVEMGAACRHVALRCSWPEIARQYLELMAPIVHAPIPSAIVHG